MGLSQLGEYHTRRDRRCSLCVHTIHHLLGSNSKPSLAPPPQPRTPHAMRPPLAPALAPRACVWLGPAFAVPGGAERKLTFPSNVKEYDPHRTLVDVLTPKFRTARRIQRHPSHTHAQRRGGRLPKVGQRPEGVQSSPEPSGAAPLRSGLCGGVCSVIKVTASVFMDERVPLGLDFCFPRRAHLAFPSPGHSQGARWL